MNLLLDVPLGGPLSGPLGTTLSGLLGTMLSSPLGSMLSGRSGILSGSPVPLFFLIIGACLIPFKYHIMLG